MYLLILLMVLLLVLLKVRQNINLYHQSIYLIESGVSANPAYGTNIPVGIESNIVCIGNEWVKLCESIIGQIIYFCCM